MHARASFAATVGLATLGLVLGLGATAHAQYNPSAGMSAPPVEHRATTVRGDDGVMRTRIVDVAPAQDRFGNAVGNQHDLAIDGAFDGQTVVVIQLYTIGFDFQLAKEALKEKGFSTYRFSNAVPSPAELAKALEKASQLWIIATDSQQLTAEHLAVIKTFFEAGHGLYIWGDNEPYYADANYIGKALFGTTMQGDLPGDQTVGLQKKTGAIGVLPNHLLTTGLEHIYEGITIATIQPGSADLKPLIYGSQGNLVAAYYDKGGRRAIFDGGFTRLYNKWDTAGTSRYVKNAAAWLVNAERFGDAVLADGVKKGTTPPGIKVDRVPAMIATPPGPPTTTAPTTAAVVTAAAPQAGGVLATGHIGWILITAMGGLLLVLVVPSILRKG